jgi:hypothetical protein
MQSLQRGFEFLKQSWQMALADHDLIKPSIFALIVGFIVTVIGSVPIALVFILLGDYGAGRVLGYILAAGLIFIQYVVTYVFSAMTIYLIYGYLAEGDGRMDRAWAVVRRDFLELLSLAAASTAVSLLKSLVRGRGSSSLSGLIDTIWTEATYLVLPGMVIEDIGLKEGLRRATHIVRSNLLLVGVSMVGVRAVTGLISLLLGGVGIALGLGVGLGIISLTSALTSGAVFGLVSGIGLGVLIAGAFILVAVVIGSYTTTAYNTCLYLWARDVEQASSRGQIAEAVAPPAPLAAVL